MNRLVNRRIRLFLAALALAFAGLLLRATWLQSVRAESLSSDGPDAASRDGRLPAGRGTIFDRVGVELALGERATTVYANPKQIVNPRQAALAVGAGARRRRGPPLPAARRSHARLRVRRAPGRSHASPGAAAAEASRASASIPRSVAPIRNDGRVAGARLRRDRRQRASRASSCSTTRSSPDAPARRRSSRIPAAR